MKTEINWTEKAQEWKDSGKSKMEFCKLNGLTYHTFLYQLKKRFTMDSEGFSELIVKDTLSLQDQITLKRPDGTVISFSPTTPKELIRFLFAL